MGYQRKKSTANEDGKVTGRIENWTEAIALLVAVLWVHTGIDVFDFVGREIQTRSSEHGEPPIFSTLLAL
jgi:hypothetical protein